ncbi:MAG: sigma-70 family RNA polymerase sigma factor [Pseudomarimonas sp.]
MTTVVAFPRASSADPAPMPPKQDEIPDEQASDADWGQLMLAAQDGDRVAYHRLLRALTPYLRAITRRYLGRGDDAEDALQDILMIVHGIRHTYERGRPFKPWLSTIASRRCIDLLRRRTHRLRHETGAGLAADVDASSDMSTDDFRRASPSPFDALVSSGEASSLRQAIDALPTRQREAIQLLRLSELSLLEAAAMSDQSIGSLKVACHRALKALRHLLNKAEHIHD